MCLLQASWSCWRGSGLHNCSQLTLATIQGRPHCHAGRPELLDQLVGHMDTFSIMESLVKLVGADEQISNYASAEQLEWLRDTPLMQMLLDRWESVGRVVRRECLGSCLVLLPGSSHTEMLPSWVAGRVQL